MWVNLEPTIERIERGEVLTQYRHDGTVFHNNKDYLPQVTNGYREWVVPTPGIPSHRAGLQRIISSEGAWYYTPDHYELFIRIR